MRAFTDVFVRHPVLALVVNLVLILVGARAYFSLPVQQFPSLDSAQIIITTVYTGASGETVRGFLTTPIERAVSAVGGIDHVESISRAGVSTITIFLELGHDTTQALAEVTARLQQVRSELPSEAEPPVVDIRRADRPYATFYLSFTSKQRSTADLTDWLTREVQPQLATIQGVQRVTNQEGGRPYAMRIWIDPDKLAAVGLAPGDVYASIQRNNYLAAVGQTKGNLVQINLLADTDLRTVDEFERLIVADRGGAVVRLGDVAKVELGAEEAELLAKYNTEPSVYLGVWPLVGANEIDVSARLKAEMERMRPKLPADVDMNLAYDGTMFMSDALTEIGWTLLETIGIVAGIVFLFLGSIRTALVPLVAMPVSLIGAVAVMAACGFSMNLLTILAIVLSVGLVVDDAIVVVENVERHVREGKSKLQAALDAARELLGPIVAMTITLAAVYAPIGFQGGMTGALFLEFTITLAAAVLVSGIVAVTLSPMMSRFFVHAHGKEGLLTRIVNAGFEKVRAAYERSLDIALSIRWAIVAAATAIAVAAYPLYRGSQSELAPIEDQSHIFMFLDAAPDATLESVDAASRQIVQQVQGIPETKFMWSLVANWGGYGGMVAKPWKERRDAGMRSTLQVRDELYGRVSTVPGLTAYPRLDPPLPTSGQFDVELVLQSGDSVESLLGTAMAVVGAGWGSGKFLFVDSDLKIDRPEARVRVDRERVADLGMDLATVGRELGALLGGGYVNHFNHFDRSYKVIPQIGQADRATLGPLLDLKIKTPKGELVPVSSFVTIEVEAAPRQLNRFQQRNSVRVFGVMKPGVTKAEGLDVLEAAARQVATGDITIDYAGESRQIRHEGSTLVLTLGFAIALVYLVLAAQFRSFRDPLVVLLGSVPLAITGALLFPYLEFSLPATSTMPMLLRAAAPGPLTNTSG
ncbi:MAG: efflux RND transporter permease subunit, partial [Planctomycetes bacterium]|nr:efflux RND transporter permease subunit [Planctomycetota bacterium]